MNGTNIPRGIRKDVRDAVKVARGAAGGWAARTAYNRGQILYRAAEALESRACGVRRRATSARPIDVLVHYAGWTDKLHAVLGGGQPGRGAVPVDVDAGADRRGRGAARRRRPRWRAGRVDRRAAGGRQRRRRRAARVRPAARAWTSARSSASATSRPASSTSSPAARPSCVPALASHRDVNAIIDAPATPSSADRDRHLRLRDPQARHPQRTRRRSSLPLGADRDPHRLAPRRRLASIHAPELRRHSNRPRPRPSPFWAPSGLAGGPRIARVSAGRGWAVPPSVRRRATRGPRRASRRFSTLERV